jgi:hypothetical protein
VFFDIDAGSLSAENQKIAIEMGAKRKLKREVEVYHFGLQVNLNTLSEDVVKWSRQITEQFKDQNKA